MGKVVALVGHCGPDSSFLKRVVASAAKDVSVVSADDDAELSKLLGNKVDLLLFNRVLDYGFDENEGVAVISRLRKINRNLKMMLVSNYPEAQAAAVAAGALPGFGKQEVGSARVKELLQSALADNATSQQ